MKLIVESGSFLACRYASRRAVGGGERQHGCDGAEQRFADIDPGSCIEPAAPRSLSRDIWNNQHRLQPRPIVDQDMQRKGAQLHDKVYIRMLRGRRGAPRLSISHCSSDSMCFCFRERLVIAWRHAEKFIYLRFLRDQIARDAPSCTGSRAQGAVRYLISLPSLLSANSQTAIQFHLANCRSMRTSLKTTVLVGRLSPRRRSSRAFETQSTPLNRLD